MLATFRPVLTATSCVEVVLADDICKLPLSRGKTAIIDAADFDLVGHLKWSYSTVGYAFRGRMPGRPGTVYLHRYLMGLPDGVVDHINGDTLDNRRANLRVTDKSGNGLNRPKPGKANTSGVVGVQFDAARQRWVAVVDTKFGKWHRRFATFDEAVEAREAKMREISSLVYSREE